MKIKLKFFFNQFLAGLLLLSLALAGCEGDNGNNGTDIDPAVADALQSSITDLSAVGAESCVICHSDAGAMHQAVYDEYTDTSSLVLSIDDVSSILNGDGITYTSTMTFSITKDGAAYDDDGLSGLDQKRYYASLYDSSTRQFNQAFSYGSPVSIGGGQYTVTQASAAFAPKAANAQVYAYIADGELNTEGMTLYSDVSNAGEAYGDAASYLSTANVEACESCHGVPYMKHGYRAAEVAGLSTFGGCKSCHVDTTNGTHPDWQLLADDPARYAELDALAKIAAAAGDSDHNSIRENMTAEELAKYQYNRSLMNDVHMSHKMEFPYPQSMENCATCHEGKLDTVLTDENFTAETCTSCHSVDGLLAIMPASLHPLVDTDNLDATTCTNCHSSVSALAPVFSVLHNGYNREIYADATGSRYSEIFTVVINDETNLDADSNILTIKFSATEAIDLAGLAVTDIVPTVIVGLYGYNTKDFIVAAHSRDADRNRLLEYTVGTEHPRFETIVAADGSWEVTADLSMWAEMITDGVIKRAEIAVLPALSVDYKAATWNEEAVKVSAGLNAPSRTFDLAANAFDDAFYSDIVDVTGGCNACHDQLATTFHSGNRGGNIKVCRLCHVPSSGASHLEMQSRSIDSYVHAVHSFQVFDPADIDFNDAVEALEYEHHVNHTYPNFTIKNCESCHNQGTYEVPDQSRSLPGKFSSSDSNYADFDEDDVETLNWNRSIGVVPGYVAGPGSRACGSCHRAQMINHDDAGRLATFNGHTRAFGYLVEDDEGIWDAVVKTIMSMF